MINKLLQQLTSTVLVVKQGVDHAYNKFSHRRRLAKEGPVNRMGGATEIELGWTSSV